jgi:dihydrodipicolinate synthase/N-acetylneuraminate lyase
LDSRAKRPFRLLVGNERILRPALQAGADGVVSGIAAALPELLVGLWRAATAGDHVLFDSLEQQLQSFMDWIGKLPPPVAIKEAAGFRRWFAPSHAVPMSEPNVKTLNEFRSWLIEWMPAMLVQSRPAAYKQ